MNGFLEKKAKLIYILYGVLIFCVLVSALIFMTQYRFIRVNYSLSSSGQVSFGALQALNGQNQQVLYSFFNRSDFASAFSSVGLTQSGFDNYAQTVYTFRESLDLYNDMIVYFALVGLVCFAFLIIFANHSRKIYYKSNLVGGILFPAIVTVFALVMIILNISLISTFSSNYDLFNIVSVYQNPLNAITARPNHEIAETLALYDCNVLTFVIYIVLFAVVIAYSVFLMIYAIIRYKNSAEKRRSVLEKAGVLQ